MVFVLAPKASGYAVYNDILGSTPISCVWNDCQWRNVKRD